MRRSAVLLLSLGLLLTPSCGGGGGGRGTEDIGVDGGGDLPRRAADTIATPDRRIEIPGSPPEIDLLDVSEVADSSVVDSQPELPDAAVPDTIPVPDIPDTMPEIGSMVLVPAGNVNIGCNWPDYSVICWDSVLPYHGVFIDSFHIDVNEVTVGEFLKCVSSGGCAMPDLSQEDEPKHCYLNLPQAGSMPVNCINWYDADGYCAWAGKRLCTEAEWEKAARCCDGRPFPWGNELPECQDVVASIGYYWPVYSGCVYSTAQPVGSTQKDVSPFGVVDMAGNLREWVSDWYIDDYYATSPFDNPTGPIQGEIKILRGGNYESISVAGVVVYGRYVSKPYIAHRTNGIRCCL